MSDVTFRDFAGTLLQGKQAEAATMLEQLLGLGSDDANKATAFFLQRTSEGPPFLAKAMGLRTAVESGSDDDIGNVLVECFGLGDAQRATAIAAVRRRYPPGGAS